MRGQLALKQNEIYWRNSEKKNSITADESDPITIPGLLRISDCFTIPTCPHKRASLGRGRRSRAIRGSYSPSCETTIQRPKERERGKEGSLNHAREVTRVNRTRNNHDSAWKKKKRGERVMLVTLGVAYRVLPKRIDKLWGVLHSLVGMNRENRANSAKTFCFQWSDKLFTIVLTISNDDSIRWSKWFRNSSTNLQLNL